MKRLVGTSGAIQSGLGWARLMAENLLPMAPLVATPLVVTLAVAFERPWIGMALFAGMAHAHRWWWTCIFGLLNALAIAGGFIACAVAAVRLLWR
ncbi:MAG: hypothetical protein ACO1TE_26635 [Prosthecobacter sp.]